MEKVTKKGLEKLIDLKKGYLQTKDKKTLAKINNYIENVINKDKHYYKKLSKYNFSNEDLTFLL